MLGALKSPPTPRRWNNDCGAGARLSPSSRFPFSPLGGAERQKRKTRKGAGLESFLAGQSPFHRRGVGRQTILSILLALQFQRDSPRRQSDRCPRATPNRTSAPQIARLEAYCRLLWDWNSKLNLTRHTDFEKFVTRDLTDSLVFARFLGQGETVLDVGTGGGVPGRRAGDCPRRSEGDALRIDRQEGPRTSAISWRNSALWRR